MKFKTEPLGKFITLQKGLTYKGEFLVDESEVGLIGMDSFIPGGGYKACSEKPYDGPFKAHNVVEGGDVILCATDVTQDGSVLSAPLLVPDDLGGFSNLVYSHHVGKVILVDDSLRLEFIYNFFRIPINRFRCAYGDTGTTVRALPYEVVYEQSIPVPSLREQDRINSFIASLDRKIQLNIEKSKTLENLAQTIFRSWFVDFDPVKAKANKEKPSWMDDTTAALFPDSMEDSELGLIPKGWSISTLADHLSIVKGKSYKSSELAKSDTALVTLKSFNRGGGYRADGLKEFVGKFKPEQVIEPGELVTALTDVTQAADVIGKPALVLPNPSYSKLVASLDVGIVRPKSEQVGKCFLYQLFLTENFQNHVGGYTNGSTVLHLGKGALEEFRAVLPSRELIVEYEKVAGLLTQQIQEIYLENLNLNNIRKLILPGLVSGELQIPEEMSMS